MTMAKKKPAKKLPKKEKKVVARKKIVRRPTTKAANDNVPATDIYILLDRSGSMETRWDEAISSINSYVKTLGDKEGFNANVTLAVFDHDRGFQMSNLRTGVNAKNWNPVSTYESSPRGATPLYDAFGRLVAMAHWARSTRAVLVVMTDGHENASVEVNGAKAGKLVTDCKNRGWEVVFLGADFDTMQQATSMNVGRGTILNTTRGFYGAATSALAGSTMSYGATGQSINFTDTDRLQASGQAPLNVQVKVSGKVV